MQQMQQMQNILQNNNNQNTSNQPQSQVQTNDSGARGEGISVIFRKSGEGQQGPPIIIQCTKEEKLSDVIEKYRNKSNDRDDSKKFIFNAKQLNLNITVGQAGLTDNANIFVVTTRGVKGA